MAVQAGKGSQGEHFNSEITMSKPYDKDPSPPVAGQTRPLGSAGGGVIIRSESEDSLPAVPQPGQSSESNIKTVTINQLDENALSSKDTITNRPSKNRDTDDHKQKSAGMLVPGERFQGKYEVMQMLGAGGMGTVYQARHLDLGTMVAIKVLNRN